MKKSKLFFVALILNSAFCILNSPFANALPPTITSFSPASGAVGTLVTIIGTNMGSPTAFTIGGANAIVVSNTGTTLVGFVMPGAVTGTVSVTTAGGTATGSGSFTVTPTPYPSLQQGSKLVGTGATGAAQQGFVVAISSDGNTAIVGGLGDNSYAGAAWVYTRSGGVWTQQGSKLVGTGAVGSSGQGCAVSISSDGNTAIVGGDYDNSSIGAVWIYTRSGGVWTQQGSKLVGTGAIGTAAQQGNSVSISSDGNTAIVGGYNDNSSAGAVWVYTRSGGVWSQQGNKLVGTGAVGSTAYQGISVSISADGNTAIVGGYNDNSSAGAVWVYTRSGGVWSQQGNKLVGTGATGVAEQGVSVSISSDGNTAIVGGSYDNTGVGAVWIYTRSGGVWSQQGSKLVGTGATGGARQGSAVSISSDGNTAIVGGSGDNSNAGAAWVYTRSGGVWTQQGNKLVGTGAIGTAYQGISVSLSSDGNTAIVGGDADNSQAGAAWVYTITPTPTITSFSPSSGDPGTLVTITGTNLGSPTAFTIGGATAIVLSNTGTTLVGLVMPGSVTGTVSVTTAGGSATGSGSFTVTPTPYPGLQQGSKLVGTGAIGTPVYQGTAVAVSADGNTAIVGGYADNSNAGAAWVYTRSGGVWTQQGSKLVGTGATGAAQQGRSVSISSDGNTAIVGATGDNSGAGAAWVYTRSGGVWTQQGSKLVGTGAIGAAGQGGSVSISSDGNTAIVGGNYDNSNAGAAWVCTRSGGVWTQQGSKLVGTGATGAAYQGYAVSLSSDGNTAIVGGFTDNSQAGAAWVYTRSGGAWTQQGNKLVGTGVTGAAQQGRSVSLSSDGNTAIVGGVSDNSNAGAAWIYTRTAGVWTQQGNKLVGTGATGAAGQGWAVSLSSDGNTAIVGGGSDNSNAGAVWVYTRSGGVWTQQGGKLVGTGATGAAGQGYAAAISSDGNTVIVGGYYDNSVVGAAWVFIPCTSPTVPTLGASTTANCGTQNTTLTIVSGSLNNATTWQWYSGSCGGTSVGSGTSISVSPTTTTIYYVRGEGGCPTPGTCATLTVTVNTPPTVNLGADVTQCGGSVILNAGNAGSTYAWSPAGTTQTITALSSNTYSVLVTDANNCTGTSTVNITFHTPPTVNLGADVTQCGGNIILNAGNAGSTYAWSPAGTTQTITALATNTYSVLVTDANNCTGSDIALVTIHTPPAVNLGADVTQCGGNVILNAGNAGSTYAWSPAGTTQTITALATNTYSVVVTDANNCTGSDIAVVTIHTPPTVNLGADVTQCGGSVILNAGNAGSTYAWSPAGTTQTITALATNTYSVLVTDANSCTGTDAMNVTINSLPVITTSGNTTICTGSNAILTVSGGTMYAWAPGGQTTTSISVSPTTSTNYTVTVTDANNCSSTATDSVTVDQCLGMAVINNEQSLAIYPNPSAEMFTIQSTTAGDYYIINSLGEKIQSFKLNAANNYSLNIENLSNGIYFIVGFNNNQIIRQKIVVTK